MIFIIPWVSISLTERNNCSFPAGLNEFFLNSGPKGLIALSQWFSNCDSWDHTVAEWTLVPLWYGPRILGEPSFSNDVFIDYLPLTGITDLFEGQQYKELSNVISGFYILSIDNGKNCNKFSYSHLKVQIKWNLHIIFSDNGEHYN